MNMSFLDSASKWKVDRMSGTAGFVILVSFLVAVLFVCGMAFALEMLRFRL
jgi:hypothetical protein